MEDNVGNYGLIDWNDTSDLFCQGHKIVSVTRKKILYMESIEISSTEMESNEHKSILEQILDPFVAWLKRRLKKI